MNDDPDFVHKFGRLTIEINEYTSGFNWSVDDGYHILSTGLTDTMREAQVEAVQAAASAI